MLPKEDYIRKPKGRDLRHFRELCFCIYGLLPHLKDQTTGTKTSSGYLKQWTGGSRATNFITKESLDLKLQCY